MIENPTTQYQDGYGSLTLNSTSVKDALYGSVGVHSSAVTVTAALLIVCRMIWPIFVYQPVGHAGTLTTTERSTSSGLKEYRLPDKEGSVANSDSRTPSILFDFPCQSWIATAGSKTCTFDSKRVGLLESAIQALKWLRDTSAVKFERMMKSVSCGAIVVTGLLISKCLICTVSLSGTLLFVAAQSLCWQPQRPSLREQRFVF